MGLRTALFAIGVSAFAFAAPALADEKSEEWVKFFIESAKLGEARALCVGSAAECDAKKNAPLESRDMRVTFEYNSDVLTPEAREELKSFAAAVNDYRLEVARFAVEGHTDAVGSEEFNDDLSIRRARAVSDALADLGVDPARIEPKGFGETQPIAADPFDPENRRVETRLIMPKG